MNRLDHLIALRSRINLEIERESAYQRRINEFRLDYRTHVSRESWSTRLVTMTAAHYGLDVEAISGPIRKRTVMDARHVAFWLLHDAGRAYAEIGRLLGKDHTTVMHGVKRVDGSAELQEVAAAIKQALHGEAAGAA